EIWSGPPLAGLDVGGLSAAVDGLVEQWLGAVEADLERKIETGEADARPIIAQLTEMTGRYPFREGLWALLMTVLYRDGRQADALAAYRRARQHLVEELGVEPGPRLQELEASILGHDDRLSVERSATDNPNRQPTGTVTFGFCDVEDANGLWAADGRAMAEAMPMLDRMVRAGADRHGGHAFSVSGDAFGVAFHRATDAAGWADDLRRRSAEITGGSLDGPLIELRFGLNTGETEEHDQGYYGPAVILASRLAAVGHGGQILASEVTAALLGDLSRRDLGSFRLDGVIGDQRIFQVGAGDHPPLRTEDSNHGNLPRRQGRLIGRDEALASIVGAVEASPIVTLVGPGGIGKTRLAVAAAQIVEPGLAGGAWLVELAGIGSPTDVARAVADALDIRQRPGRTVAQSVVDGLESRRALLVLDNCEHVIDGAADMAQAIAENCVGMRIVATSREGLALPGEKLISVAPLDPARAGVELFNERASGVASTVDGRATAADIEEICRRLDGVPLAIELAAARTTTLSPSDLIDRLDDRLRLLTGGRRTGLERHRTLRATIQWSYDLLTTNEQTLFQRLSIFSGPFDLNAAEAVAAGPPTTGEADRQQGPGAIGASTRDPVDFELDIDVDIDTVLGALVEQSMVIVESGPFGRRFRLLESMRQFGAEHLSASGETDAIARQHATWCLAEVSAVRELLAGHREAEGVTRLNELWPNLRGAFDWAHGQGDPQLCRRLIDPIATEIYVRHRYEIGHWAERLLEITPDHDEALVTFGVIWAGRRYMRDLDPAGYERLVARYGEPDHPMIRYGRAFLNGDFEERSKAGPEAAVRLRREGDHYQADLFEVIAVGLTLLSRGRLEEHDVLVSGLVERYRADGPPTCVNWALTFLGMSAAAQGRQREAGLLFDEAANVDLPEGTQTWNQPLEARAAFRRGHRTEAFTILRRYIDQLVEAQDMNSARSACGEFINLMVKAERFDEAKRVLDYLETTNTFDIATLRDSVAGAARRIAERATDPRPSVPSPSGSGSGSDRTAALVDDRDSLVYMSEVLGRLASDEPSPDPSTAGP
ncbi:MAG: AfsR/SARP family transcriptional regulator, partial [Acidimicrobiales bacterium]